MLFNDLQILVLLYCCSASVSLCELWCSDNSIDEYFCVQGYSAVLNSICTSLHGIMIKKLEVISFPICCPTVL